MPGHVCAADGVAPAVPTHNRNSGSCYSIGLIEEKLMAIKNVDL